MKAEVWFYHLERQPAEDVLPRILAGLFARGERSCVHAPFRETLQTISKRLWGIDDVAFVAHGLEGDAAACDQPVWLTTSEGIANAAKLAFFIEGAQPAQLNGLSRASIFFDGSDDIAVERARGLWKAYVSEGHTVKYWRQSDAGRWEDQAVRKAAA